MPLFEFPFTFLEPDSSEVKGVLRLEDPTAYSDASGTRGAYRRGVLKIEGSSELDLVLYHNPATAAFIYLRQGAVDSNLARLIGLDEAKIAAGCAAELPGQLCLGADRVELIGRAVDWIIGSPVLSASMKLASQHQMAVFPIAREGLKYQVCEAIHHNYGHYCDEIILDAHHVFDSTVPIYKRKVEMTLFKDKDLDQTQKENIHIAFIADSIASGLVMKEVIGRIKDRFDNVQGVEVISPLATIRGLCRVARARTARNTRVRVHVFETLLNALPPDYYYSAHFPVPELHIRPDLEAAYREWWGTDGAGKAIADTACAGYGWSEVFFSPRKQIEMINQQLGLRHQMTIAEVVGRRCP